MATVAIADAVIFDEARKTGKTQYARISSVLGIAEPLLGLDKTKGQKGHVRRQPYGKLFITGDPADSLLYAIGSEKEGQGERYNWVVSPDDEGISLGYLKDKQETATAAPAPAVAQAVAPTPANVTVATTTPVATGTASQGVANVTA